MADMEYKFTMKEGERCWLRDILRGEETLLSYCTISTDRVKDSLCEGDLSKRPHFCQLKEVKKEDDPQPNRKSDM